MSVQATPVRKITISLPDNLVEFADREAARLSISRSRLIAQALSEIKAKEEERHAAEGYRFYAQEASALSEIKAKEEERLAAELPKDIGFMPRRQVNSPRLARLPQQRLWTMTVRCVPPELQCKKRIAIPA